MFVRLVATLIVAAFLSFAGVASAQPRQLVVGIPSFPDSLSTGISSFTALTMSFQVMDPLFLRDEDGKILPGLATEWHATDDRT